MGNTQSQPQPPTNQIPPKKFVMHLRERDIVIDYKSKTKLTIGDLNNFPAGYEGLRLWDSNIILARYLFTNKIIFKGKKIIELLSGTGIASLTAKKFTEASQIAATDHHPEITGNILYNCKKNQVKSGMIIASISWKEHENFKNTFDFVIGADIITKSCPTDLLQKCLRKLMNIGAYGLFVVPKRSLDLTSKFMDGLDKTQFECSKTLLSDQIYSESPLLNQVQGFEEYPLINDDQFYLVTIQKIKNIQIEEKQVQDSESPKMENKAEKKQIQMGKIEGKEKQESESQKENRIESSPKENVQQQRIDENNKQNNIRQQNETKADRQSEKQVQSGNQENSHIEQRDANLQNEEKVEEKQE